MKWRVLVGAVVCVTLAACGASKKSATRTNDPYGSLSQSDIYLRMGIQYMEAGNYDTALQDLIKATELDEGNSEAYNALAVLYQRLDQPADAERQFKKALSANSENFGVRNNYGRFLCEHGRHDEAMDQFRKVIASKAYHSPWVALTNAGICARSAGRKGEAEEYLRKALEYDPRFAPALIEMAELSRASGENLSARAFLERYHAVAAPNPRSLLVGVEAEAALGNFRAAKDYATTLRVKFSHTKEAMQAKRFLPVD
ncbi:putative type IV pilus biogenesis protein PilF [Methylocaldum marinum]|uniref:Putative type IV pilus biogenesis protein PilF n=1 Tax=Methylocaldum marinum TaxID=1432792 RepID=A0A250KU27_9GAMM|nr:type IV pilus biogenesis/stability protein PilW [Methylocaldum marinum]BBA35155.1 putative type IV pilus biogenesis protein PilF [Methylocaldum marinum]